MTESSDIIVRANKLGKRVTSPAGELTILQDINFSIESGTSLAIVGVSGSGKSTLLGLLAGLDVPSEGNVTLNDCTISGNTAQRAGGIYVTNGATLTLQDSHVIDNHG